jgi:hypothetical protein
VSIDESPLAATVRGWWQYQRLATGSRAQRKALSVGEPAEAVAGWEAVRDRVDAGGTDALRIVVELISTATDDTCLAAVGAGPLEDLLHEHGDSLIDAIETEARRSPPFANALASVWVAPHTLAPNTERRLGPWIRAFPAD